MTKKTEEIGIWAITLVVIVLLNFICSQFFFRLDLTEEKRYTISDATKNTLRSLDDIVYIEVYLEGDFPAGFKRLQRSTREMLDEFRIYAGNNLQYKFVDPGANTDPKARNKFYYNLAQKGIQPTNLFAKEGDKNVEKIIFPGALVSYGADQAPVMLLKGQSGANPDEILNRSVEALEYELAYTIKKLSSKKNKKKIAYITGHNELMGNSVADLVVSLREDFDFEKVDLRTVDTLKGYDLAIIAKPDTTFSDDDKFKLDQYIVKGGKAMFFLDAVNSNIDSIGEEGTYAFAKNLNIDDMLFKYGVRVNADLISDMQCAYIPMFVGYVGDQKQTKLMNWRMYPVINNYGKHPITKSLDVVYSKFISTIDTVKAVGIKKTPLMFSSRYSKILPAPVRLNFNEARIEADPNQFNKGPLPVAYLLEGKFTSVFTNRLTPESEKRLAFKSQDKESKVIVVSDGDIVQSEINKKNQQPYPMGYDRYTQKLFANKDLLLNMVNYMLDDNGLVLVKAKEVTLRPLDKLKLRDDKLQWQIINLSVPILSVLLMGIYLVYSRNKRYNKQTKP